MCGIFASLSTSSSVLPSEESCCLLRNRGPDCFQVHTVQKDDRNTAHSKAVSLHLTFVSTVLSLRGDRVCPQPLVDRTSKSVLCWNGEAWKIGGEQVRDSDTELVFQLFLQAVQPFPMPEEADITDRKNVAAKRFADAVHSISGPFSFVFYDAFNSMLFFSRDCLGRRSLLQGLDDAGNLKICSVCDGTPSAGFEEVATDGVHMIDLEHVLEQNVLSSERVTEDAPSNKYNINTLPWDSSRLRNPIPAMNKSIPEGETPPLTANSPIVGELEGRLHQSLQLRIQNVPWPPSTGDKSNVKVAVLFSGGLDCTILARLSHDILPIEETIDLLNVAFENPRVAAAAAAAEKGKGKPAVNSVYESCPDRVTGRAAFAELQKVCPDRNWRFVTIDIPYVETIAQRDKIKRLMRPHNTEMDLSIASALYFASRGQGTAIQTREDENSNQPTPYSTPARVLLSGLGADELFAGYARHEMAFSRRGFQGLIDEIDLDVSRLGKRNLGRDDRIISNWCRETRYPYLDEEFVSWVVRAPVWEKCGFGASTPSTLTKPSDTPSERTAEEKQEQDIEPGKKALRLLALKLGLNKVSREKKRAIQFGSRTAKMERGKARGTEILN